MIEDFLRLALIPSLTPAIRPENIHPRRALLQRRFGPWWNEAIYQIRPGTIRTKRQISRMNAREENSVSRPLAGEDHAELKRSEQMYNPSTLTQVNRGFSRGGESCWLIANE